MIEAANRDINLVRIWCNHERQGRAALRAKGAHSRCPVENSGLASREAKLRPPQRRPRDKRRAAAATAIRAVTVRDVIRLSGRLVTHGSTQAPALNHQIGLAKVGMRLQREMVGGAGLVRGRCPRLRLVRAFQAWSSRNLCEVRQHCCAEQSSLAEGQQSSEVSDPCPVLRALG